MRFEDLHSYDGNERSWEKHISRQEDERALASGEKSAEQLRRENGHFAGMDVKVDFKRGKSLY